MTMNIDQKDLDQWRAYLEQVRKISLDTLAAIEAGTMTRAAELAQTTAASAARMGVKLEAAGAHRPEHLPATPDVRLELLMSQANRRFLTQLHEAMEAARAVDAERGYPDGAGPNVGILSMILNGTEIEIYGPAREGAAQE
jgi:hypothetical protein